MSNGAQLPPPDVTAWILQRMRAGLDLDTIFSCTEDCKSPLLPPQVQSNQNQFNIPEFDWNFARNVQMGEALNCARHRLSEAGIQLHIAHQDAADILHAIMKHFPTQESNHYYSALTEEQAKLYKDKIVDRINGTPLNKVIEGLKHMEAHQG